MESADTQSAPCDLSLGSRDYVCWEHPYRAASQIRMHAAPLRTLADEALHRIKVTPASEIGGLLWGRIRADPRGSSMDIIDAEIIPSGGPLHNTGCEDARLIERALKRSRADGLKLLGYFRSHIRDGLCLSPTDQEFIKNHLCDPECAFLLIRPFEMGICMGAFFFWQNGRLQTDGSDLEVPFVALDQHTVEQQESLSSFVFRPKQITRIEPGRPGDMPTTPLEPRAIMTPPAAIVEERSRTTHSVRKNRLLVFALAAVVLMATTAGIVGYFVLPILKSEFLAMTEPARNPGVGLRVMRAPDGQLDLTWNRSVLEAARARDAQLIIKDGSLTKELAIDAGQLRSGTLTYFPSGMDVQFRLEVALAGGRTVAESVRVILPGQETIKDDIVQGPAQSPPSEPATPGSALSATSSTPSAPPEHARFRTPTYIPPRVIVASKKRPINTAAPDLRLDNGLANGAPPAALAVLLSQPPRSGPQAPPMGTTSGRTAGTLSSPPAGRTVAEISAGYIPPRPIRQVMPDVKLAGRTLTSEASRVAVQVSIDESGRVKDARLAQTANKANGLVANAAIAAARQWAFQPASLHGRAVAAEHVIVFEFRSQDQ
jgi:TonB family protein